MIAIISDIHGNFAALSSVLTRIDEMGISDIICLGDVGGYYCEINECCEALRSRNILTLMGNHDWYLATGEKCPRSNSVNICLDYQRKILSFENLEWLKGLKPSAEINGLQIVHGGWNDPIDEYLIPSDDYFSHHNGNYFASGHTHVQIIWTGKTKAYCNPGSVGQPRDGDNRAAFATWDDSTFSLHRTPYNILDISNKMAEAGFDPYFYENLMSGTRIGGKIDKYKL